MESDGEETKVDVQNEIPAALGAAEADLDTSNPVQTRRLEAADGATSNRPRFCQNGPGSTFWADRIPGHR